MTTLINRYDFDPSGLNPNNLVSNETHILEPHPVRVIAPMYGAFFINGLVVIDSSNNNILVRNVHYKCTELLQDLTKHLGLEIYSLILIIDPVISSEIEISYQTVGGYYQQDLSNLINLYTTMVNTNGPVDWNNILNRPETFPPTLHRHFVKDIYGYEPVVYELERIVNAITLNNVPLFEALLDYVQLQLGIYPQVVTEEDIDNVNVSQKLMTYEMYLYALTKFNFNNITVTPSKYIVPPNQVLPVEVSTTNTTDNTQYYWVIEHITTGDENFAMLNGVVTINSNTGNFNVITILDTSKVRFKSFRIKIVKSSVNGFLLTKSSILYIKKGFAYKDSDASKIIRAKTGCCIFNPRLSRLSAINWFFLGHARQQP